MSRLFLRVSHRLFSAERRRRSIADLAHLDDRLLRDIGLNPAGRAAEIRRLHRAL